MIIKIEILYQILLSQQKTKYVFETPKHCPVTFIEPVETTLFKGKMTSFESLHPRKTCDRKNKSEILHLALGADGAFCFRTRGL